MSSAKLFIAHVERACQAFEDQRQAQIAADQAAHRVAIYDNDDLFRVDKLHALALAASKSPGNENTMTVDADDFWTIKDFFHPEG